MRHQKPEHDRIEHSVYEKLEKGWNAFTREEVEALIAQLRFSRSSCRSLKHRLHTSHGEAVGWHFEGDIGLHERRPAPVGAVNLFEKARAIDFEQGWRIPKGCKVSGFRRTKAGELVVFKPQVPRSPNDWMRIMHEALHDITKAYKVYEHERDSAADQPHSDETVGGGVEPGASGGQTVPSEPLEQSNASGQDLPID